MRAQSAATALHPSASWRSERNTLRACHIEAVHRLAVLPLPPTPSVYDPGRELGHVLLDQIAYLRQLVDTVGAVFECVADDAADYGGARVESYDIVRAATEDFIAPITNAAEGLVGDD